MPRIEDGEVTGEDWLNTTFEQVQEGEVSMGVVDAEQFSEEQWERDGSMILTRR